MGRKVAAMDRSRIRYTVTLDCHHEILFSNPVPQRGEDVWCVRCNREALVMSTVSNYRLECQTCNFGREYGRAKVSADRAAARHRFRNGAHHIVDLYDGLTLVYRFGANPRQLVIELTSEDQIPF